MIKLFRRVSSYLATALTSKFDEKSDPKIQLQQAMSDAQDQHRRLREQAAIVIANQKQTEMRLNRAMGELEKITNSARQAVLMADDATQRGDTTKSVDYARAAQAFANRLVAIEDEVETLKSLHLQTTEAADKAKAAVAQNSTMLQRKLMERQKLLSQLDQAKMQEQMNRATATLSESVGQDVPTFEEVRLKIEARYAKALGVAEIQERSLEHQQLDVEQAVLDREAQARLEQIRIQVGLPASSPQVELTEGTKDVDLKAAEEAAENVEEPVQSEKS